MTDPVRTIINTFGGLPVDANSLAIDADLFQAGMTSHATLSVMLALEAEFDIEFPDEMLRRNVFSSVWSIRVALGELGVLVA